MMTVQNAESQELLADKTTCLPKEDRIGDKEFDMLMLDGL
jgi:hypothetical protein